MSDAAVAAQNQVIYDLLAPGSNWRPENDAELLAWGEQVAAELKKRFTDWVLPLAEGQPASRLAQVYTVARRLNETLEEAMKVLQHEQQRLNNDVIPSRFEDEDVTSFTTADGYRVSVSINFRASIPPQNRDRAYAWLRDNGLQDLIVETVNAGTLSAAGRVMLEEGKPGLPEDIFTTFYQRNTSMTKVRK